MNVDDVRSPRLLSKGDGRLRVCAAPAEHPLASAVRVVRQGVTPAGAPISGGHLTVTITTARGTRSDSPRQNVGRRVGHDGH
jgi:hypothetical protein